MNYDTFTLNITVNSTHIDDMQHVNNVVYLQWVQEVALAHWNTVNEDIRKKYNWVALRHEIDYKSQGFVGDELIAQTWVHSFEGVKSIRMVQIIRTTDNKLLAEARSTWCLLNAANNRPTKVPDEIRNSIHAEV
ncbi:MAG TPA: acyl-CoA thioesterase [Cytophagales bacterium]|jgi:acyl-CoA thioester hydrolase|nr:acyl-CoA thioesterase [Cytophagales bacterium]